MAGWMTGMVQFLNLWVIRIVVLSSLAAHLFLILLAKIRRRKAIGVRRTFLWLAYQGASWVATSALGRLTIGRTLREQQLVTFWAPFLLLHLGGPDNISAYSLEDNILSGRQIFDVIAQLVLAGYGLYRHIYTLGSEGPLFWAFVIMYFFGAAKYVEKSFALWKGDMGSIRSSSKKPSSGFIERVGLTRGQELDNERALLVAHDLFHISKGAFVDYSVMKGEINGVICSSYGWKGMCKVVEMELSLMYDILYTKAAVVHTWFVAVVAALWLFCFYNKDDQRRGDVVITYILLVATFHLDLMWLLTALGSTWTYAFLNDRPGSWLHHQLLCTRRWHRFHRLIVSLHSCSWLNHQFLCKKPASYRLWLGSIGQYNLLHECTHATTSEWRALAKKFSLEDTWMEYHYHYSRGLDISGSCSNRHVRKLFEQIWTFLKSAYPPEEKKPPAPKPEEEPPPLAYMESILRMRRELEEALNFDKDFQEDILIWHIATDVFLLWSDQNAASSTCVKAIKVLSDYMVFLVVARPNMVPGLKLRSTYEAIRKALDNLWRKKRSSSSLKISPSCTAREKELAKILRDMENKFGTKLKKPRKRESLSEETRKSAILSEETSKRRRPSLLYDESIILSEGTMHAEELLKILSEGYMNAEELLENLSDDIKHFIFDEDIKKLRREKIDMQKLLGLIFKTWVRLLIYASIRCSRDSHAKQLSRGGELTTIVWILQEHTSILRIRSDTSSDYTDKASWILAEHARILRTRSDETDENACSVM